MDAVKIGGVLTEVILIRENCYTVIVRAPGGKAIKRHKRKHCWLAGGL